MKPDTTLENLCAVAASYLFLKEELLKARSACDVAQKNLDLKILAFKKAEAKLKPFVLTQNEKSPS